MKKRYLGLICVIYALFIIYEKLVGSLNNFLAPRMQINIIICSIVLFIFGLVLIFNRHIKYEFKVLDLLLLFPLIFLVLAGDGKVSLSLADNRTNNFLGNDSRKKTNIIIDDKIIENYDFSNVDFDVVDEVYAALADEITFNDNVSQFVGKTIRVRGFIKKEMFGLPSKYMALGKYIVTCCVADSSFGGFIIDYDKSKLENNSWYEIEGIIKKDHDDYGDIAVIDVINVKEIKSFNESLYVYPCTSYGNENCDILKEINYE